MWDVIANIASICSIIALPIAIWQIFDLKSKVKSTETGIRKVLEIKEYKKLDILGNIISVQYTSISDLLLNISKKGHSIQSTIKTCQNINKEINKCIVDMPSKYDDISKICKDAVKYIEAYLESNKTTNDDLKEARDYLYNAMQSLKKESKKIEDINVDLASHYGN